MGLDQYLKASKYLSGGWSHSNEAEKKQFRSVFRAAKIPTSALSPDSGGVEVVWTAFYWRKANAIHAWFVRECQKGVDECQQTHVSREKLAELLSLCVQVAANWELAATLLPPQSGFFFGSTDIDEWYKSDIQRTIKGLNKLLNDKTFKDCEFYYQSSW